MTAEEIRQFQRSKTVKGKQVCLTVHEAFLIEIAAQLAELNEWLRIPRHIKEQRDLQARAAGI